MAVIKKRRSQHAKRQQQQLQEAKQKFLNDRLNSEPSVKIKHDMSDTISYRNHLLNNFKRASTLLNVLLSNTNRSIIPVDLKFESNMVNESNLKLCNEEVMSINQRLAEYQAEEVGGAEETGKVDVSGQADEPAETDEPTEADEPEKNSVSEVPIEPEHNEESDIFGELEDDDMSGNSEEPAQLEQPEGAAAPNDKPAELAQPGDIDYTDKSINSKNSDELEKPEISLSFKDFVSKSIKELNHLKVYNDSDQYVKSKKILDDILESYASRTNKRYQYGKVRFYSKDVFRSHISPDNSAAPADYWENLYAVKKNEQIQKNIEIEKQKEAQRLEEIQKREQEAQAMINAQPFAKTEPSLVTPAINTYSQDKIDVPNGTQPIYPPPVSVTAGVQAPLQGNTEPQIQLQLPTVSTQSPQIATVAQQTSTTSSAQPTDSVTDPVTDNVIETDTKAVTEDISHSGQLDPSVSQQQQQQQPSDNMDGMFDEFDNEPFNTGFDDDFADLDQAYF